MPGFTVYSRNSALPNFPEILFEDNHLLVVNKPAELATQGAAPGQPSLADRAKDYLKEKYQKPGNVYLGVVSRLDAMVTGAIVLARTSKAASRLSEQFRSRTVEKTYWAIIPDRLTEMSGQLVDCMRKNEARHCMMTCPKEHPQAQVARLRYHALHRLPGQRRLIEIQLETGRKHQIRVQFSSRNCPILGDRKYNSTDAFPQGIALHARRLEFSHPTTGERLKFVARLPASWPRETTRRARK